MNIQGTEILPRRSGLATSQKFMGEVETGGLVALTLILTLTLTVGRDRRAHRWERSGDAVRRGLGAISCAKVPSSPVASF